MHDQTLPTPNVTAQPDTADTPQNATTQAREGRVERVRESWRSVSDCFRFADPQTNTQS